MYFKLFLCSNCAIEDDYDDNIISFKENNKNGLCQNNINNNNKDIKSILSTSDNNSTYNLEIIEYPYTLTSDDNITNNYKPNPLTKARNTYLDNNNNYIEFSNFFHKIKPPNLFVKKNNDFKKPELTEDILVEKIKNIKFTNENENKDDLKESKESSLINNEDSIINNKDFIENYNSNLKISKVIKNNTKLTKIISEINVDCPPPDSNNFAVNIENRPNLTNQEDKKIFNELLENKNETKINGNLNNKKQTKSKKNFNKLKSIKFNNLNLKKISSLGINQNLEKTYTNFNTDLYMDKIKQSNKDKKKKDAILKRIKQLKNDENNIKSFDEPYYNKNTQPIFSKKNCRTPLISKYNGLKTENNNNNYQKKARKKYLSNTLLLSDILMKKKHYNYRNTVFNIIDKKKKYKFLKTQNKRTYYESLNFYENPFSTVQKLN